MPANRLRTERWRTSLRQIADRNGSIEVTLPRYFEGGNPSGSAEDETGTNLIWRVRILSMTDTEIVIEEPSTMGTPIVLEDNIDLVVVMTVGQNRWMFKTSNIGLANIKSGGGREMKGYRIGMPETVERCQRRSFFRISTVGLVLPQARCWPVLDPASIAPAELACQDRLYEAEDKKIAGAIGADDFALLPEVGPPFTAMLVNIGGGGVGLMLEPGEYVGMDTRTTLWMGVDLLPGIAYPIGIAGRIVHTHLDSEQRAYLGISFDFGHTPKHAEFVTDRICKYVNEIQREQLKRRHAESA